MAALQLALLEAAAGRVILLLFQVRNFLLLVLLLLVREVGQEQILTQEHPEDFLHLTAKHTHMAAVEAVQITEDMEEVFLPKVVIHSLLMRHMELVTWDLVEVLRVIPQLITLSMEVVMGVVTIPMIFLEGLQFMVVVEVEEQVERAAFLNLGETEEQQEQQDKYPEVAAVAAMLVALVSEMVLEANFA